MPIAYTCIIPYAIVTMVALFAGPLFSKLFAAPYHTVRLAVDAACLLGLGLISFRTVRHMPDNGKGSSFLRRLIVPLTTLLGLIIADKTLRVAGLPLIDEWGPPRYTMAYAAGLTLCGTWISVTWLLNLDPLSRFFAPTMPAPRRPSPTQEKNLPLPSDREETPLPNAIIPIRDGVPITLGRYKILKEIGRGAMGVVYLGKDPTIQRFVAIKTMLLDRIDSTEKLEQVTARFFREAESTGRLSHPNIVTIYDAGNEQDLAYIAMEMLEGTTLNLWSRQPRLMPLDQLLPILAAVAEALDYAHEQGVVHRDIKPANIMVTNGQLTKVMDFGIAQMTSCSQTKTDLVVGTPIYMSPEQVAGKKVDGRSDIFSLGVVLFELLTGRPPFTADTMPALLFAIAHTPATPLADFRPDLPPRLQQVLDQALQKDPVHRYRRARDFAEGLRACVHASTV
jgi:eukaryotic-like serine/threonine-protein kinase